MNDHFESDRRVAATGATVTNQEPKPKRYQPPNEAQKGFAQPSASIGYKRFASSATRTPSERGQPQLTGLLISACLETETAAAGTSRTQRLSAFTYALLDVLRSGSPARSARELFDETAQRLKSLSFRQTPVYLEMAPGNLVNRTFITMEERTMTAMPTASSAALDTTGVEIPEQEVQKAIFSAFVTALPAIVSAITAQRKELEVEQVENEDAVADQGKDESREKIFGALAGVLLPEVINFAASQIGGRSHRDRSPRMVRPMRPAQKALDLPNGDHDLEKKLLPDLWRMAVAAAPDVVNVIRQHASRASNH